MGNATQRYTRRIKRIVSHNDVQVRAKRIGKHAKRVPEEAQRLRFTRILKKVSVLRSRRSAPVEEESPKGTGFKSNQERRIEKLRQLDALTTLNTFQKWEEAQAWIKKQERGTLEFVLGLINKFDEDASYIPSNEEVGRLKDIYEAWTSEPPDWW